MKRVCAWCQAQTGEVPTSGDDPWAVTHGICPACEEKFFGEAARSVRSVTLAELLEQLDEPVFVMEDDVAVGANRAARGLFDKELPEILARRSGEIFECVHAQDPAGCGNTVHCSGCTVRRAVQETLASGLPLLRRIVSPAGRDDLRLRVTTERRGQAVLLRVERLDD